MIAPCALATAAEALVGVPFRLHGRVPATGLDCVGVIACALAAAGAGPRAPRGYGLRDTDIARFLALASANGLVRASGPVARGDLLLVSPGPAQHHLACASGPREIVHAHAGLGRVVRQPLPADWPLLHHWRLVAATGRS